MHVDLTEDLLFGVWVQGGWLDIHRNSSAASLSPEETHIIHDYHRGTFRILYHINGRKNTNKAGALFSRMQ